MPTTQIPYNPAPIATTTTVPETITTTTVVCTVTSHDLNLSARKDQPIAIPFIDWRSSVGGKASFVRINIVAVPAGTDGVLKLNGNTLANSAQISAADNGKIIFEPVSGTFDGGVFTYNVVTTCGTSATMTGTIALAPDLPSPCPTCP